ncbi:phage capsid protein [Streptomyces platensis]|uniref:phage capsid protein n=1 Tax=Streptomyces platensis TaxID=58346 RepID=UPI002ED4E3AF|nr:phage capsid protein [Streptomyces platensis]
MAVDTFVPEVWSAELLTALQKSLVFGQGSVSNRNYEGEIANSGDTVHIGSLTAPTIADYVKNSTVIDPATLATTDQTLVINQAKYFAFEVDDVDARQVKDGGQLLTRAASEAAYKLADATDQYLAGLMTAGAGTALAATDVTSATPGGAYNVVLKAKVTLDKANVPQAGRFLIVSPDFYAVLLSDPRFVDASQYGSSAAVQNGEVGRVLGFAVMVSNNLPAGTAGTNPEVSNFVVAGHSMATTYAEQISKVEAYRPQSSFSDAVKGLHLYGAKVVRPEALVVCDVDVTLA